MCVNGSLSPTGARKSKLGKRQSSQTHQTQLERTPWECLLTTDRESCKEICFSGRFVSAGNRNSGLNVCLSELVQCFPAQKKKKIPGISAHLTLSKCN